MTTEQIIIFSILGIIWLILYFKVGFGVAKSNATNGIFLSFAGFTLVSSLFILFAISSARISNSLNKELQAKFPKLEKVEDVYKIIE